MYELRVEGIARDGRPALGRFRVLDVVDGSVAAFRSWGAGSDTSCTTDAWAASNCVRVPPGIYSVSGFVFTMPHWAPSTEEPGQFGAYLNTTLVAEPEVVVDGPTTLTLDAREEVEVRIETPDHRTARTVPLAEVNDRIAVALRQQKQQELAQQFVQALKARGKVEILI